MKNALGLILAGICLWFGGYFTGHKQPPFTLLQATELTDGQYTLMLEDHSGNSFLITLTIEKALALGIDTNEIITIANQ